MSENSKISWTDHTLHGVFCLVAVIAKRQSVCNVEAQFREVSEWLNVVGSKVSACCVSALLACEFVAEKNIISPALVFLTESLISALCQFAIFKRVTFWATDGSQASSFADCFSFFDGARPASVAIVTSLRPSHSAAVGKDLALHGMNPGRICLSHCPHQFHFLGARHG